MKFNPASFIVNIIGGWFVATFLQVLVMSVITGKWSLFIYNYRQISMFRNHFGALVNLMIILFFGLTGVVLAIIKRRSKAN